MQHDLEAAVAAGGSRSSQNIDQVAVPLVVVPVDPPGAVALSELQQQCGEIVGQVPIVQAGAPERMPHEDVKEERLGRKQHRTDRQQPLEQVGRVEQWVRPSVASRRSR